MEKSYEVKYSEEVTYTKVIQAESHKEARKKFIKLLKEGGLDTKPEGYVVEFESMDTITGLTEQDEEFGDLYNYDGTSKR